MESLKQKILAKKELRGIPPDFLEEFLKNYEQKHKKEFDVLKAKNYNEKSKEFNDLKKQIRRKLRELHGVFSKNTFGPEKKTKLLEQLSKADEKEEKEILKEILLSHRSTLERYDYYKQIYALLFKKIQKDTKNNLKILDLGCGYNPFSYGLLKNSAEYVAVDINEDDMLFIQNYFDIKKINGKTLTLDLTIAKNLEIIQKESENTDFCFLFKLLDSLEAKKRGSSEELLNHLNSRTLVISFPLKTIGGRKNITGERRWFESILKRKKYVYELIELENEKYYIVHLKNS